MVDLAGRCSGATGTGSVMLCSVVGLLQSPAKRFNYSNIKLACPRESSPPASKTPYTRLPAGFWLAPICILAHQTIRSVQSLRAGSPGRATRQIPCRASASLHSMVLMYGYSFLPKFQAMGNRFQTYPNANLWAGFQATNQTCSREGSIK